jgi:nucleoside-diphosphate-sugar epimerase
MTPPEPDLVVAVTGPTGTFGFGLAPLLEADPRITRVVGIARRPFDPAAHGWTKMTYRQGDVRDPATLEAAFEGVDVVVHLAFLIASTASRETSHAVNVGGTINVVRAAAAAGATRLVYASSVAAYGFHSDNPVGMTEDWPTRPAAHLGYAQDKAELEQLLAAEAALHPDLGLYLLRPPIVLGPHAVGGKELLSGRLASVGLRAVSGVRRWPLPVPAPVPPLPMQLIHEEDVGRAFLQCIVGAGPPGTYNIAADDVLTGADIARELGILPLPVPKGLVRGAARVVAALPLAAPAVGWAEALTHPAIMDSSKAKRELGWTPRHSAIDALRAALDGLVPPADGAPAT